MVKQRKRAMNVLSKLGQALDQDAYEYLAREQPSILGRIEEAVKNGAKPQEIGEYIVASIGPDRMPFVRRCVGAARFLESEKE
jgi:alkylhydroperoxidase/carboxymuconolactone decarboxylase family protein YurZ